MSREFDFWAVDERRRHVSHAERDEPVPECGICRAEAAIAFALEELRKWPDLPGVQLGVVLLDAPGPEERIPTRMIVPPERFVGVFEALSRHALGCWRSAARSIAAYYAVQDVAARVRRFEEGEMDR